MSEQNSSTTIKKARTNSIISKTKAIPLLIIVLISGFLPIFYDLFYDSLIRSQLPVHSLAKQKYVLAYYYPWYANATNYTDPARGIFEHGQGTEWIRWVGYNYTIAPNLTEQDIFYWRYGKERNYSMASVAHWPVEGMFDSSDPEYILRTFEKVRQAGIDVLICDYGNWLGWQNEIINNTMTVADELLKQGKWAPKITMLMGVSRTDYQEYCNWHADSHNITKNNGEECLAFHFSYMYEIMLQHESFFKVDGKPVIFTWSHYVPGYELWKNAMTILRQKYDFYLLADWGYYKPGPIPEKWLELVDGVVYYNPVGYLYNSGPVPNTPNKYQNLWWLDWKNDPQDPNKGVAPEITRHSHLQSPTIRQMYINMDRYMRNRGKFFAPTVISGYDDRMIYPHADSYVGRTHTTNYGARQTYDGMWEDALASNPSWVVICSWNEWHEGTEIDESVEYGRFYIDRTTYYSNLLKS
jgi:hypothetical protein